MSWWIRRTKFGMGLIAIREDEDKAGAVGVNTSVYKVLAFVASAVLIGVCRRRLRVLRDLRRLPRDVQHPEQRPRRALGAARRTRHCARAGAGRLSPVQILKEEANSHHFGTTQMNLVGLRARDGGRRPLPAARRRPVRGAVGARAGRPRGRVEIRLRHDRPPPHGGGACATACSRSTCRAADAAGGATASRSGSAACRRSTACRSR